MCGLSLCRYKMYKKFVKNRIKNGKKLALIKWIIRNGSHTSKTDFFVIVMFYGFSTRANKERDVKGRRGWSWTLFLDENFLLLLFLFIICSGFKANFFWDSFYTMNAKYFAKKKQCLMIWIRWSKKFYGHLTRFFKKNLICAVF